MNSIVTRLPVPCLGSGEEGLMVEAKSGACRADNPLSRKVLHLQTLFQ